MRRILHRTLLAALLMTLALPLAAQSQSTTDNPQSSATAGQMSATGGRYDQEIQQKVTQELQKHDKYKNIRAQTNDGIVTLEGQVPLYIDKANLQKTIRKIDHVQGIRNLVQVSSSIPDSQLEQKLADKLRYDRIGYGIMFNNLNLKVNNGVVTIGGQVRDYPSAASAVAIVETQPGVKDVVDDIQVLPTSNFDDDLRIALARAIYGDPALQKYAIDPQAPMRIVVNNGHVTLDGVVDSQMDKQIAETRARSVPGVFSVKDNLVVANQQAQK